MLYYNKKDLLSVYHEIIRRKCKLGHYNHSKSTGVHIIYYGGGG